MLRNFRQWIGVSLVLLFFIPTGSQAGSFYIETGFGLNLIQNGTSFFSSPSGSTGMGFGTSMGFIQNFSSNNAFLQLHIGVKTLLNANSGDSDQLTMMSVYPLVRFEFPRFYFGVGVTPLAYGSASSSAFDLTGLRKSGTLAYYFEGGLLWRVTHFFHIAFEGSTQFVKTGGATSPAPAIQGLFQMRFFLPFSDTTPGGGRERPDGWRYPFGIEIWD